MYLVKIIIIFVIVWWVLFFMALPFGIKKPVSSISGQDSGAPEKPKLWLKFFVVSIISLILTIIINFIIRNNLLGI